MGCDVNWEEKRVYTIDDRVYWIWKNTLSMDIFDQSLLIDSVRIRNTICYIIPVLPYMEVGG